MSKLDELKGENPFKVPENYFEEFNKRIMEQLPEISKPEAKKVSLFHRVRPLLYAAVFLGILLVGKVFFDMNYKSEESSEDLIVKSSENDLDYLDYLEDRYVEARYDYYIEKMEDTVR